MTEHDDILGDAYWAGFIVTLAWLLTAPGTLLPDHGAIGNVLYATMNACIWPLFWPAAALRAWLGML